MSIWKSTPGLERLNAWGGETMMTALGMRITEIGEDFVRGSMPVDGRTHQPFGLLHGGASAALAETLASTGANLCCDPQSERAVGLEINCNHIRAVTHGQVIGTARPLHIGRSTQVWEVRIEDEAGKLVCASRMTCAVVPARSFGDSDKGAP